jgi:tRNA threonylcarbamoyladenosine biosynthesis protein TsaE
MLISSPEAMIALGTQLAQAEVTHILLYGDLGAGKTHFVKGYVAGCGLDPYLVQSPTYTYFHDYAGQILHMDMYRLDDQEYFVQKGMFQHMQEFDRVLIEWPKFIEMYGEGYTKIRIEKVSDTEREVLITSPAHA